MHANFYGIDPFNRHHERNSSNTFEDDYNCGGFALNTFTWYQPFRSFDDNPFRHAIPTSKYNEILASFTQFLLHDFRDIRHISTIEEVRKDEYGIAMRIGNRDFHFIKQEQNQWREKMGRWGFNSLDETEVFQQPKWHDRYDSRIILFAKRKSRLDF